MKRETRKQKKNKKKHISEKRKSEYINGNDHKREKIGERKYEKRTQGNNIFSPRIPTESGEK